VLSAADGDLEQLMAADEQRAEDRLEEKYAAELASRKAEVDEAIAAADS